MIAHQAIGSVFVKRTRCGIQPDGNVFAFALVAVDEGVGYRVAADAQPGQAPKVLGTFRPVTGEDGCWQADRDEIRFCAAVEQ